MLPVLDLRVILGEESGCFSCFYLLWELYISVGRSFDVSLAREGRV